MVGKLSPLSVGLVSWFYAKLTHRSLLRVRGVEALQFLQGIVTNDTRYLSKSHENHLPSLYSLMLNTQGRLLYDLILYVKNANSDLFLITKVYRPF